MCRHTHAHDKGLPVCYLFGSGLSADSTPLAHILMNSRSNAAGVSRPVTRRAFLSAIAQGSAAVIAAPLVGATLLAQPAAASAALPAVVVYKDAGCGCCKEWVKHMQKAGFKVTAHDTPDMDGIKTSMGVPSALQSCHTAVVGSYLLEGHVPADLVQKLLREKPVARGLAVPGMPSGSPGMEGGPKDKYDVVLFERSGKTRVYASR